MNLVNIDSAYKILKASGVVALPTETVYGLGGWIFSEEGLKKIFHTKERPFFDPLIVHVDSVDKAKSLTNDWTQIHEILAQEFWPGPLTLISKKNEPINPLITSGLDSVGLRCPKHELTLKLLSRIDGGIAAPSANKFGKTSPTSALHVHAEFGNEVPIIDGGPCLVGIESTVVGFEDQKVKIYRPGLITAKQISEVLKKKNKFIEVEYAQSPVAPGQLKHHYMPKTPIVIVPENFELNLNPKLIPFEFKNPVHWRQPLSAEIASRELYQKMREFDEKGYDLILAEKSILHEKEEWLGVWNRLDKAKSYSII